MVAIVRYFPPSQSKLHKLSSYSTCSFHISRLSSTHNSTSTTQQTGTRHAARAEKRNRDERTLNAQNGDRCVSLASNQVYT